MLLSLRKGLGAPTALPLDDAFHPDVSHWIHLVAVFFIYFHFLFLFDFDVLSGLFWLSLLSQKNQTGARLEFQFPIVVDRELF